MLSTTLPNVLIQKNRLYTKNLDTSLGTTVYNESLTDIDDVEYRSWNPYRSKLAAALQKQVKHMHLQADSHVLYLGAASGTTVSHISDIVSQGMIYAVESAALPMKKLLKTTENRPNIIPLLHNARLAEQYLAVVPTVDMVYQDISQRDQTTIFLSNIHYFLKPKGIGVLMIKARSINVSAKPTEVYASVNKELISQGLTVVDQKTLSPFEKDHAVFVVRR